MHPRHLDEEQAAASTVVAARVGLVAVEAEALATSFVHLLGQQPAHGAAKYGWCHRCLGGGAQFLGRRRLMCCLWQWEEASAGGLARQAGVASCLFAAFVQMDQTRHYLQHCRILHLHIQTQGFL